MKTTRFRLFQGLFIVLAICFFTSCEKKDESSLTISDFKVESESDTAPCKVNVIYSYSSLGKCNIIIIHEDAYLDEEFKSPKDSTESVGYSTRVITWTDTINLYYLLPGDYEIRLIANGKEYSEEFKLD